MNLDSVFVFRGKEAHVERADYVARIPSSVGNREALFTALSTELRFPEYFGRTWDSLSECLRDLSWIEARRVVILHMDVPPLEKPTLVTYLEVLAECVRDWKAGQEHELIVVFPPQCREQVEKLDLDL